MEQPKPRRKRPPAKVVAFEPSAAELAARIRKLAAEKPVGWGTHALGRMDERGISRQDALRVLRLGEIRGPIEAGKGPTEWKCKMVFQPKGQRGIGVATVVINMERLFLKTVEWEDK